MLWWWWRVVGWWVLKRFMFRCVFWRFVLWWRRWVMLLVFVVLLWVVWLLEDWWVFWCCYWFRVFLLKILRLFLWVGWLWFMEFSLGCLSVKVYCSDYVFVIWGFFWLLVECILRGWSLFFGSGFWVCLGEFLFFWERVVLWGFWLFLSLFCDYLFSEVGLCFFWSLRLVWCVFCVLVVGLECCWWCCYFVVIV